MVALADKNNGINRNQAKYEKKKKKKKSDFRVPVDDWCMAECEWRML
jgi:hypothetical protein